MDEPKVRTADEWDEVVSNLKARYIFLKKEIAKNKIISGGFRKEIKRAVPPTTERDCPH